MTRFGSPSVPGPRATTVRVASVLCAASLGLLPACSGGSSATHTTSPTTSKPAKTTAVACSQSSVSASVEFTKFGGSSSSLAGGVLFKDTGSTSCSLRGVPTVEVVGLDGQPISTYQERGPAAIVTAVLTPAAPAGTGVGAASSVTFSSWTCTVGSFTLTVEFPGWASSMPAAAQGSTTSTTGIPLSTAGPPCTETQEPDQTIYIGPVTPVTS